MLEELNNNTLVVVPCYNARKTITDVIFQIHSVGYSNILISDDYSSKPISKDLIHGDNTILISQKNNLGYGGNQKYLYNYAIEHNFKYVVMIHGDLQYTPKLIPSLISMLHFAKYDFVFGSRILGGNALKNGMPIIRYIANRFLTFFQNLLTGYKLSEYHSGLRAYKVNSLKKLNFKAYSNNFLFDNEMILGFIKGKQRIGEVSCITRYDTNSSSINYYQSTIYAIGVIKKTIVHLFNKSL